MLSSNCWLWSRQPIIYVVIQLLAVVNLSYMLLSSCLLKATYQICCYPIADYGQSNLSYMLLSNCWQRVEFTLLLPCICFYLGCRTLLIVMKYRFGALHCPTNWRCCFTNELA